MLQCNRDKNKGGGVATSFVNADAAHVLKIHEGTRNELLVTRIDKFAVPINIVNLYGKQECRTGKNEIEEDWQEVLDVLAKIDAIDEEVLLLGDMNRMVGNIVKGNHDKVSFGGSLIRELLTSGNYSLLNARDKVENNPFTRFEPNHYNNKEKRSCLDLAIASRGLSKYLSKFIIDESLNFWRDPRN